MFLCESFISTSESADAIGVWRLSCFRKGVHHARPTRARWMDGKISWQQAILLLGKIVHKVFRRYHVSMETLELEHPSLTIVGPEVCSYSYYKLNAIWHSSWQNYRHGWELDLMRSCQTISVKYYTYPKFNVICHSTIWDWQGIRISKLFFCHWKSISQVPARIFLLQLNWKFVRASAVCNKDYFKHKKSLRS